MKLLKSFWLNWRLLIDTFIATARGDEKTNSTHALDELGKQARITAHWMTQYLLAQFIGRSLKEKEIICHNILMTLSDRQ